ncbi:MAG TPA: CRTAC1 family protein [Planctomycetes bacterium]|nr:CRTAC1 family protein [Planctomycetota bacterium]
MISPHDKEDDIPEEPADEQDDEIIATAFRGSLKVFMLVALLALGIWWLNLPDNVTEVIEDGDQVPVHVREVDEATPVLPFTDISVAAGIDFTHDSGGRGEKLLPETMGSGAVFADLDGDSDPDLLLASGRPWPWTDESPTSSTVRMWINKGHYSGTFIEVTEQWNLHLDAYCTGMAVGDVDGDGDLDLFVAAVGEDMLLINEGSRSFRLQDSSSGVSGHKNSWSTSAAFFDADGDDDLDLFICEYVRWSRQKDIDVDYRLTGLGRAYGPPTNFEGTQCRLLLNDGSGHFEDVSRQAGIHVMSGQSPVAKALAVIPVDINGDGAVDVMVANDTTRNFLFINRGDGTFEEAGVEAGLAYDANGSATGAMGLDISDYRNDGSVGVAVANFSAEMTGLYRSQRNDMLFLEESVNEGIGPPSRKALSFGLLFMDVDLDGRQDLIQANGHLEEEIAVVQPGQEYRQSAQLFWNRGPGNGCFEEIPTANTGDLGIPAVGRGLAYADIDGDGDLDLILTQAGDRARLLRNDQETHHHWLRIDPGRLPPGGWIELHQGDRVQRRLIGQTRSYLSQCENIITFGLGEDLTPPVIRFMAPGKNDWQESRPDSIDTIYSLEW